VRLTLILPILPLLSVTPAMARREVALPNSTIKAFVAAAMARYDACNQAIRARPEFAPLWRHMTDPAGRLSVAQTTDETFPTAREAALLAPEWDAETSCFRTLLAIVQLSRPDLAALMDNQHAGEAQVRAQLVERRITWAEAVRQDWHTVLILKKQMAAANQRWDAETKAGRPHSMSVPDSTIPTKTRPPKPKEPQVATNAPLAPGQTHSPPPRATEAIPLKEEGGGLAIPVLINGQITLDFMIDSGSSDVSIPPDVVSTLMRTGTIQKRDFSPGSVQLADGSIVPSKTFLIRSLKVGNHLLENVEGSVANSDKAPLLLGRSVLNRFSSWSIDNKRQVLLLNPRSDVQQAGAP